MLRNALFTTAVVTAYLVVYCLVAAITANAAITSLLFIFSPFLKTGNTKPMNWATRKNGVTATGIKIHWEHSSPSFMA